MISLYVPRLLVNVNAFVVQNRERDFAANKEERAVLLGMPQFELSSTDTVEETCALLYESGPDRRCLLGREDRPGRGGADPASSQKGRADPQGATARRRSGSSGATRRSRAGCFGRIIPDRRFSGPSRAPEEEGRNARRYGAGKCARRQRPGCRAKSPRVLESAVARLALLV